MDIRKYLPATALGLVLLALPDVAYLATAPDPCSVIPSLPCNGNGASGLASSIQLMVFSSAAKTTFGAFLGLYFFIYGARLILQGEQGDIVEETKMAYAYGITGAVMYIFAGSIISAVGSQSGGINTAPVNGALTSVIGYADAVIGSLILVTLTYQAFKLILKRGDEGAFDDLRKRFVFLMLGVAVYALANVIVAAAYPGTGMSQFIGEVAGLIRYILQIIGALSVLSFIFAGFLYVISVDEGQKERAQKTMKNTVIALIVVLFSYTIISFVANGFQF